MTTRHETGQMRLALTPSLPLTNQMKSRIKVPFVQYFCLSLVMLMPSRSYANKIENLQSLQLSNDLNCKAAKSRLNELALRRPIDAVSGKFNDFKSGESVDLNIPAEDIVNLKQLSGTYMVGANSSIMLRDGTIIYRKETDKSLRDAVSRYLQTQYNYKYFTLSSKMSPTLDYSLRGEIPLQAFLTTKRSKGASESSDLQASSQTLPNDFYELFRTRRIFTAYSDLGCIYVFRHETRKVYTLDMNDLVFGTGAPTYFPLFNNDLIYIPVRERPLNPDEVRIFAQSPYASDVQISVTGSGASPKVLLATSGSTLFEILANSNVLKKGFSSKITIYRYNTNSARFDKITVKYPKQAMSFIPKDKDILSVGLDAWSQALITLNDVTSPVITALSTFFYFRGVGF